MSAPRLDGKVPDLESLTVAMRAVLDSRSASGGTKVYIVVKNGHADTTSYKYFSGKLSVSELASVIEMALEDTRQPDRDIAGDLVRLQILKEGLTRMVPGPPIESKSSLSGIISGIFKKLFSSSDDETTRLSIEQASGVIEKRIEEIETELVIREQQLVIREQQKALEEFSRAKAIEDRIRADAVNNLNQALERSVNTESRYSYSHNAQDRWAGVSTVLDKGLKPDKKLVFPFFEKVNSHYREQPEKGEMRGDGEFNCKLLLAFAEERFPKTLLQSDRSGKKAKMMEIYQETAYGVCRNKLSQLSVDNSRRLQEVINQKLQSIADSPDSPDTFSLRDFTDEIIREFSSR